MSLVNVINVLVLNNPCPFTQKFSFEITFECLAPLEEDLEWNVVYVGSAETCEKDQILEQVQVGPVPQGMHKFVLTSDAVPDVTKLDQVLGVTVVLVTCTYREQEFVRIGYYVNNEMMNSGNMEDGIMEEDENLDLNQVVRTILADKPRVTRFPIQWDTVSNEHTNEHTPLKFSTEEMELSATTTSAMSMDPYPPTAMAVVSPPSTQSTTAMEI